LYEKKGISLEVRGGEAGIIVMGDEPKIEQVLYNFVNNSCNHTAQGGNITIGVFENAEAVRIEVLDNGEGIAEEELPYVWDRFYKAANGNKGTGLGLAIAKEILKAHSCSYGVESKPGEGAKFWFDLKKAK
jgi:signal transduction histidine kinase